MKKIIITLGLAAASLTISGCEVKKTQDAKLPAVDVKASGGQLPKFEVKGPDVNVGTKSETIQVPTVHVTPASKKP